LGLKNFIRGYSHDMRIPAKVRGIERENASYRVNAHGGDEMGIVSALSSNVVLDDETFVKSCLSRVNACAVSATGKPRPFSPIGRVQTTQYSYKFWGTRQRVSPCPRKAATESTAALCMAWWGCAARARMFVSTRTFIRRVRRRCCRASRPRRGRG